MSTRSPWLQVNIELYEACEELLERISPTEPDVFAQIVRGFLAKGTRTLRAVNLLTEDGLWEQAQIMARVLFELRVNFDYLLKLASEDTPDACARVMDAMMLDKIKQLEASQYAGLDQIPGGPSRHDFQQVLERIQSRYSKSEISRLRRYGFTGLSLEDRAREVGHELTYQIVYRNFSRNVHSTDYVEHMGGSITLDNDYLDGRNSVTLYVAHCSAGGIAEYLNLIFHSGMEARLDEIGRKQTQLRRPD